MTITSPKPSYSGEPQISGGTWPVKSWGGVMGVMFTWSWMDGFMGFCYIFIWYIDIHIYIYIFTIHITSYLGWLCIRTTLQMFCKNSSAGTSMFGALTYKEECRREDVMSFHMLSFNPAYHQWSKQRAVCVFFSSTKDEDRSHKTHKTLKFVQNVSGKRDPNEFLA